MPFPLHFYPKYLTSYVVMLQLSNNPQLIKYVVFIINFYELEGNVLSLENGGGRLFSFLSCLPVYCEVLQRANASCAQTSA